MICYSSHQLCWEFGLSRFWFSNMVHRRAEASTEHTSTSTGKSVLEYNAFTIFMFIILIKTITRVVLAPALVHQYNIIKIRWNSKLTKIWYGPQQRYR